MQTASLGGMYGADNGATFRVQALTNPGVPSMGTAVDATMNAGSAASPPAVAVQTYNILPASIGSQGLLGNTVAWWFALILVIIAIKFLAEKNHDAGQFSTIRVGLLNILIVTLMSVVGKAALKMLLQKYRFAGLTDLVTGA